MNGLNSARSNAFTKGYIRTKTENLVLLRLLIKVVGEYSKCICASIPSNNLYPLTLMYFPEKFYKNIMLYDELGLMT